jgi:hypothetical protein
MATAASEDVTIKQSTEQKKNCLVWVFLSIYFEKSSFCLKESSENRKGTKKGEK